MPNSLQTKKPGTSFHTAVFEEIIYGGGGGGGWGVTKLQKWLDNQ